MGEKDWAPGDRAVCINAGKINGNTVDHHLRLVQDKIYEVEDVIIPNMAWRGTGDRSPGLVLAGCPSDNTDRSYWHGRFRKVRPDPHEGEKEDFIRLWNLHRPKADPSVKRLVHHKGRTA